MDEGRIDGSMDEGFFDDGSVEKGRIDALMDEGDFDDVVDDSPEGIDNLMKQLSAIEKELVKGASEDRIYLRRLDRFGGSLDEGVGLKETIQDKKMPWKEINRALYGTGKKMPWKDIEEALHSKDKKMPWDEIEEAVHALYEPVLEQYKTSRVLFLIMPYVFPD